LQGKFSFCADEVELATQLIQLIHIRKWEKIFCKEPLICQLLQSNGFDISFTDDIATCDAAITGCDLLVARTGSMILSTASLSGRTTSVYAPIHICIAKTNQLVYNIDQALEKLVAQYGDNFPSNGAASTFSGQSLQFGGFSDGSGNCGDKYFDLTHFGGNNVGGLAREMNADGTGYFLNATTSTGAGGFKATYTIFIYARDISKVSFQFY
jgi:hypothetical protein